MTQQVGLGPPPGWEDRGWGQGWQWGVELSCGLRIGQLVQARAAADQLAGRPPAPWVVSGGPMGENQPAPHIVFLTRIDNPSCSMGYDARRLRERQGDLFDELAAG